MVVRRLLPSEAALLRDVRLRALREEPAAFWATHETEVAFDDEVWVQRLSPDAGPTFVAENGDEVVGLVTGVRADDGAAELVGMWVGPVARGTGVADALVGAVVAWAADERLDPVRLWVMTGNERAERLYRRLGFETTKTEPDWFEMVRR